MYFFPGDPYFSPIHRILSAAAVRNYLLRTVGTCWQMMTAPIGTTRPPTGSYVEYSAQPKIVFGCLLSLKARAPPCYFENMTKVVFPQGTLYVNTEELWYSWLYDFSVFRSLWYKNTLCKMYQVRTYHTPAILRYTTHTREPWPKLADFDTTISHSFLGQISFLKHRNPSWVSAPATHQTCFASVAWGCGFPWGLFKASVKLADLASESQRWYSGASPF